MTGAALQDRVFKVLWPSGSAARTTVWVILDCARDSRIYDALRSSGLDYLCLYSGRLHPEVEAAAPYLVEVAPTYSFTSRLVQMGWGKSWGVFLRIEDPSNLRHHLRGFLRVQDDAGKILIFRYYDPRVLRVYLPTCSTDELRTFFGPISSFLVEGEDGKSVIEFEFDGATLRQRQIALAGETAPV